MAARQLIPEPTGADTELDPGSERAHPNSADKGSTQVRLRARARAWGTSWPGPAHNLALLALAWATGQSCPLLAREVCAAKTPSGVAAPPFTITASAVHYKTSYMGYFIVVPFKSSRTGHSSPTCDTPMALTITSLCTQQIVSARNDPVVPTAAVAPTRTVTRSWEQPQACTPCHCACLAFLGTWTGPGSGLAGHLGSVCGKDSLGVAARPIYTTTFAVHFCRLLGGGQLHSNIQKTGRMSVRVPV
jgi:hypothetical protein